MPQEPGVRWPDPDCSDNGCSCHMPAGPLPKNRARCCSCCNVLVDATPGHPAGRCKVGETAKPPECARCGDPDDHSFHDHPFVKPESTDRKVSL